MQSNKGGVCAIYGLLLPSFSNFVTTAAGEVIRGGGLYAWGQWRNFERLVAYSAAGALKAGKKALLSHKLYEMEVTKT